MRPFSAGQAKFLKAFTEALFHKVDMVISADQVVENIQTQFTEVDIEKIRELRLSFGALSLVLGGFIFRLLPPRRRAQIIDRRIRQSKFDLFQDMARLRGVIYAGYYGHWVGSSETANKNNPVHKQIGFILPAFRKDVLRDDSDVPLKAAKNRDLHRDNVIEGDDIPDEVDVIVIGSGAGGAVSAYNVAKNGHRTLILDAGPYYPSGQITFEERRMTSRLYKDGALQTSLNNDFVVFQAKTVGGGPVINNGICLRPNQKGFTHPKAKQVFNEWDSMGASLDRKVMEEAFCAVEDTLEIKEMEQRAGRRNGPHLLKAFDAWKKNSNDPMAKDAIAKWFRKNYGPAGSKSACAYCGYCNTGCRYGRKKGMVQSYLPAACNTGLAHIVANASVHEIIWDNAHSPNRRATGVACQIEGGPPRIIRARKGVILAAGTIASSQIMRKSGYPHSGYNISLNVASPFIARMPDSDASSPVWDEDQMSTYIDMGEYLIESHFQPPMSMAAMMPGWFDEHARRMQAYGKVTSAGILFPADRKGTLQGNKLDFQLDKDDMPLIRRAATTLSEMHFAAGAEEVYAPLTNGRHLNAGDDVAAFFEREVCESDDIILSSSHPHGGNPMHDDPGIGVVDTNCRVHGTANCYITDASVFPSCIRVNAQLTTMAMAEYATGRGDIF